MSQTPKAVLKNHGTNFTPTIHNDTYDFIRPEQFDLKDRAVFITGASRGCGKAIALAYAKAGTSFIAIAARSAMHDLEKELHEAAQQSDKPPPQVLSLQVDVTSSQSVTAAAEKLEQTFPRLDILINNAGYLETFRLFHETDVDDWWRSWEVNIKGTHLITRALLPLMLKSSDSLLTVLNLSSIGAHWVLPGSSAYSTNKLALLRLSECLEQDYADKGLISFGVHPGGVSTELARGMPGFMHQYLTDDARLSGDTLVWLTAERREWLGGRYVSCTWDMKELLDKRKQIEEGDLLRVRMDVGLEGHA